MKKKNGFTLIELLAIIVILAIIAVITVPIILGIIDDAKKGTVEDSAYGYKDAVNKWYIQKLLDNEDLKLNGVYTVTDGALDGENVDNDEIPISGSIPKSGYLTYENNILTEGCLTIDEYAITFENEKISSTEKGECEEAPAQAEFILIDDSFYSGTLSIFDEYAFKPEHFYVVSTNQETTVLITKNNLNTINSLQDENSASTLYHSECEVNINKYKEKLETMGLNNATARMPKKNDMSILNNAIDELYPGQTWQAMREQYKDKYIFNATYWLEESCCGPDAYNGIDKDYNVKSIDLGMSDNNTSVGVKAIIEVPTISLQ